MLIRKRKVMYTNRINCGVVMLSRDNAKPSGHGWFGNQLDTTCLLTDFSKCVIRESDSSTAIDQNIIQSDVLGSILPAYRSDGSKTLICIMYIDWVFYLTAMGRNCYPFLAEIASRKIRLCV